MQRLRLDEDGTFADATEAPTPMSIGKLELLPAVERTVRARFRRTGVPVTEREIYHIAHVLLECSACDIAEIYSPPRLTARASSHGLVPGFCIDLSTQRSDGEYWDLSRKEDQQ